jgi:hypothetical protein
VRNAFFTARRARSPEIHPSYSAILKKVITTEVSGRGRHGRVMTGNFAGFQQAKFPVNSRLTFLSPEEPEKV